MRTLTRRGTLALASTAMLASVALSGCAAATTTPAADEETAEASDSAFSLPDGCSDAAAITPLLLDGHPEFTMQLARAVPWPEQPGSYFVAVQFTATGADHQVGVWAVPSLDADADIYQIYAAEEVAFNNTDWPGTAGTDHDIPAGDAGVAAAKQCIVDSGGNEAPVTDDTSAGEALPEGWPAELPVPPGEMTRPNAADTGWSAYIITSQADAQAALDQLAAMFTGTVSADGGMSNFHGAGYNVLYSWLPDSTNTFVTVEYIVVKN